MKKAILYSLLSLMPLWVWGQQPTENKDTIGIPKTEIQEIVLEDSVLKKHITAYLQGQLDSNKYFKEGVGFIQVNKISPVPYTSAVATYTISWGLNDWLNEYNGLPHYYTFVDGWPVLFFDRQRQELFEETFSKESSDKLEAMLKPFLPPIVEHVFEGKEDKLYTRYQIVTLG